ncbi:MAG TPA: NADH-quinone oxidoreductase subunit NuoH [Tepidisphaeraceae bacterium]|jgi:NADH-quinone oxidoreductase subunit H|nr:NADH-quinone oxidoreductase subunit NuoH [Tepidisphaeraceae bacterium]
MREFFQSLPPWVFIAIIAHAVVLGTVAYLILLERKVAAWVQDRLGPNRVGPKGLLQPIADGLKFIFKEDFRPAGVDRVLFTLAPAMFIIVVIISIAVVPLGGVHEKTVVYDVSGANDPKKEALEKAPRGAEVVEGPRIEERANAEGESGAVLATVVYRYPVQIAKLDIGALFIIAVLSLAVYGVVIGGWASNNKYSFLGGLRATAQMISYEIPLGLSLLCIVVMFGTLQLDEIVNKQAHYWGIGGLKLLPAWNVFAQPMAFLMFLICIHAEANRAPFDLAEAEQELVGGYHTEYSAMRFAMFFLAEYMGMITTSAVCVALFFGGWHFPGLSGPDPVHPEVTASMGLILARCLVFFVKTMLVIFVFMWARWSLPRFRFDQLMMLAWRALIPLSLLMLMTTAIVVYVFGANDRAHMRVGGRMALVLLVVNGVLTVLIMLASRYLPAAPQTNRKIRVEGSRFETTPVAAAS